MPTMPPQQTCMPAVAHMAERVEPVLVAAGGDDGAVVLRRGIEVVVVVVEAGLLEPPCLRRPSACRASRRSPARAPSPPAIISHTLSRSRSLGSRQAAPMQKRLAPARLAVRASASTASSVISFSGFDAGIVMRALRTIAAVLRATAGLDRQQRGHLHLGRVEVHAMDALRAEHQLRERQREQRAQLLARPVVTDGAEILLARHSQRMEAVRSSMAAPWRAARRNCKRRPAHRREDERADRVQHLVRPLAHQHVAGTLRA